jgi:hypothetical protein
MMERLVLLIEAVVVAVQEMRLHLLAVTEDQELLFFVTLVCNVDLAALFLQLVDLHITPLQLLVHTLDN